MPKWWPVVHGLSLSLLCVQERSPGGAGAHWGPQGGCRCRQVCNHR